jgi:hypothetical protein
MTSISALKFIALWVVAATGDAGLSGSASPAASRAPGGSSAQASAQAGADKPAVSPVVAVTVANPLAKARARETVSVMVADVLKTAPGFEMKKVLVVDAAGKEILSQLVDMNGDESPDELVFQTDLGAKESKTFRLKVGQGRPAARDEYRVYGRFVRERHDDFAWENDLVAHRVYGPDLETCAKDPLTSSGVDTWVKRVPKLVVNDWYITGNYHQDMGEGADYYAVGKSRGLGGLGVWADGKLHVSKNFTHSRVLANGPIRLVFELTYAPWDVGGKRIGETRRVILDAGTQFNRFESTFTGTTDTLSIGAGIAKHQGSVAKLDARGASLRVWEPLDGGKGGNLGTALVFPSGTRLQQHDTDLEYLVVTGAARGRLVYHAGSVWDRAGRIRDPGAWAAEIETLASRLAAPVKVKLHLEK